ncbi:GspE/PulE family protein [Parasphingorhabdus halotolerans]|uniref:GspE/PulE family protein n=1 Tax=Parasphingorhabdus halotolerans TaxID=2725558 RepID=UPI0031B58AF9
MDHTADALDAIVADIRNASNKHEGAKDQLSLRLIYGVIAESERQGASTIHLESNRFGLVVRMRIDGVLTEKLRMPKQLATDVIERLKKMAQLDLSEHDFPQEGIANLTLRGNSKDIRISTLPNANSGETGERIVLHLLDAQKASISLDLLGMSEQTHHILTDALLQPNGLILVAGPPGSGKTTTLYAAVKQLNDGNRNILTVENPIEYALEGIGQTQIDSERGLNFADGLAAILRQDPDIVMVGEISDRETAEIAVDACVDGHLVLAAINTNSAVSAIVRMRDMQVDPFLMASSLRVIIGQRMVHKLCEHCRVPIQADGSLASLLGFDRGTVVFREMGCNHCNETGFQGRIGVFEAICIDKTIRKLINEGSDEARLSAHAFYKQPGLASAGRTMVREGLITAEEGIRISRRESAAASHPDRI